MEELSPPEDEFPSGASLSGPALLDDSTSSLLQDDNIGIRPTTSEPMAVSDSSSAPTAVMNGNAQARRSITIVDESDH